MSMSKGPKVSSSPPNCVQVQALRAFRFLSLHFLRLLSAVQMRLWDAAHPLSSRVGTLPLADSWTCQKF